LSVAQVITVAFKGVNAIKIDVQVHIGNGLPHFAIVGLPDKSIGEAKERIRAMFNVIGLSLPPKRITVNMSPASMQKEGSHYDLPIAIGILVGMGIIQQNAIENWVVLGELSLDGSLQHVPGILIAAMFANMHNYDLICPYTSGSQAKLAGGNLKIIAPKNIREIIAYLKGDYIISDNFECALEDNKYDIDMKEVNGQEVAKRALEIAALGGFHVLFIGPPGVGKSMLAKRMITILPSLNPQESLEVTMIYSMANKLEKGILKTKRPYREPHHSSSLPALVGGGSNAMPGEISLAHNGVLFMDELAEYSKALEGLRQSMESGEITIARAQNHITYPAKSQVIAAMNPCKCGNYGTSKGCVKESCARDYQNKVSGPIFDRFDLIVYLDNIENFDQKNNSESSAQIRERIENATKFHNQRYEQKCDKLQIEEMNIETDAMDVLIAFGKKHQISRRSFVKIGRVARAIANLDASEKVQKRHMFEAMMYRRK